MVKKQPKDSARTQKRHIERRPAGQPAAADNAPDVKLRYPVPQPRPIPLDHPARDIFRKENLNDLPTSEENPLFARVSTADVGGPVDPTNPASIPMGIPAGIPTSASAGALAEPQSIEGELITPAIAIQSKSDTSNLLVEPVRKNNTRPHTSTDTAKTIDTPNARSINPVDRSDETTQATTPLDATHSASEKIIYSIMYRETISRQVRERHFGPAELMKKSGIRSRNTVHQAIYGLIRKLSIEVVSKQAGNALGPRYCVYRPQEVEERRRRAGIFIDEQTKKITDLERPLSGVSEDSEDSSKGIPVGIPTGIPNFGIVLNSKDSTYDSGGSLASSSSKGSADDDESDDDELVGFVKDCYVRTTGNEWTAADATTVLKARDIRAEIWGIAICYCVDRAPDHKFARLAYVVEEARRHQEEMKEFSASDLRAILEHSTRLIARARLLGAWQREAP